MTEQNHVHYLHTSGELRIYSDPQGYEKRQPHSGFINVLWLDENTAMLRGAIGRMQVKTMLAIVKALQQQGAKKLLIKRRKGKRVPFGRLIESSEYESTFEVDLTTIEALQ